MNLGGRYVGDEESNLDDIQLLEAGHATDFKVLVSVKDTFVLEDRPLEPHFILLREFGHRRTVQVLLEVENHYPIFLLFELLCVKLFMLLAFVKESFPELEVLYLQSLDLFPELLGQCLLLTRRLKVLGGRVQSRDSLDLCLKPIPLLTQRLDSPHVFTEFNVLLGYLCFQRDILFSQPFIHGFVLCQLLGVLSL